MHKFFLNADFKKRENKANIQPSLLLNWLGLQRTHQYMDKTNFFLRHKAGKPEYTRLLSNSENRENLKIFGMIIGYLPITIKFRNTQANIKTTNY